MHTYSLASQTLNSLPSEIPSWSHYATCLAMHCLFAHIGHPTFYGAAMCHGFVACVITMCPSFLRFNRFSEFDFPRILWIASFWDSSNHLLSRFPKLPPFEISWVKYSPSISLQPWSFNLHLLTSSLGLTASLGLTFPKLPRSIPSSISHITISRDSPTQIFVLHDERI